MQKKWSDLEIEFLKENYSSEPMEIITSKLSGRSLSSITNKAHNLGLKNRSSCKSDLRPLLEETNEAYYWVGFLLADGHFTKLGQIQLNLSEKDFDHVKKFAAFVKYTGDLTKSSIYVGNKLVINELIRRFSITNKKTYTPPNLSFIKNDDLLISLIIGFIDGDGSISKKGNLYIKVHKNWFDIVKMMVSKISSDGFGISISNNVVTGWVCRTEDMKRLKKMGTKLKLPILDRKWDRVNFNKLSKKERRVTYDEKCFKLFDNGKTPLDLIKETQIVLSRSFIYDSYKRWRTIKERDIKIETNRQLKNV